MAKTDNWCFFEKTAEQIWMILVSDEKYGCLTRNVWIRFCIWPQGSMPQLKKFWKNCCKKVLPSVVTAKGGHTECAPFCVFALHSYLECTKGRMGYKILQSYLQVVRCLKMWQQFEFGFLTGSNPAPPNLLKSTLASPVWNTGGRLVLTIFNFHLDINPLFEIIPY